MNAVHLLLALLVPSPESAGAPVRALAPQAAPAPARDVSEDMVAYGTFLMQLQEAQQPVLDHMAELPNRWAALDWEGDLAGSAGGFRTFVREVQERARVANERIAAIPLPDFGGLELPPELRPGRMRDDMMGVNREISGLVAGFPILLDAVARNDLSATQRATADLIGGTRALLRSQMLLLRAGQASIDRSESAWDLQNIELLMVRGMIRLLDNFGVVSAGGSDPGFAAEMRALAVEGRASEAQGRDKAAAELAEAQQMLTTATRSRDREQIRTARLMIGTNEAIAPAFALGGQAAELFERAAAEAINRNPASLSVLMLEMRDLRLRLFEIGRQGSSALAGQ